MESLRKWFGTKLPSVKSIERYGVLVVRGERYTVRSAWDRRVDQGPPIFSFSVLHRNNQISLRYSDREISIRIHIYHVSIPSPFSIVMDERRYAILIPCHAEAKSRDREAERKTESKHVRIYGKLGGKKGALQARKTRNGVIHIALTLQTLSHLQYGFSGHEAEAISPLFNRLRNPGKSHFSRGPNLP